MCCIVKSIVCRISSKSSCRRFVSVWKFLNSSDGRVPLDAPIFSPAHFASRNNKQIVSIHPIWPSQIVDHPFRMHPNLVLTCVILAMFFIMCSCKLNSRRRRRKDIKAGFDVCIGSLRRSMKLSGLFHRTCAFLEKENQAHEVQ